jgi:hypothetical protein
MDTNYFNHHSIPNSLGFQELNKKKLRDGLYMSIHRRMTTTPIWRGFPLSILILNTQFYKYSISIKMSLKNYDSLVDLSEHVQNMRGSLKLVFQVNDSMCKILLSSFQGPAHALYNNLKPSSIQGLNDFCTKFKKSSTKLFDVAQ